MIAKKRTKKAQAQRADRMIQYIGLVVALIVVAAIVWRVVPWDALASNLAQSATGQNESAPSGAAVPGESKQYDAAPPMTIDVNKEYFATIEMEKGGKFMIELYADKAPIAVNSFVFLAREGFFDGVTFHRVLEGFMAQSGDPTGSGMGGPGYQFVNEDSDLTFDKAGVVAMANAGRDTNGSQFFITFGPAEFLNGSYTIFGQVIDGMDVVNGITRRDPDTNPSFAGDTIGTITIAEE